MFDDSTPVLPDQFIGRKRELRRIASRIAEHGQTVAVIGQPRTGKTSILSYFASSKGRGLIEARTAARLHVTYLDAHALPAHFDHVYFWKSILEPALPLADAAKAYAACRDAAFEPRAVEGVLACMREADVRLVVLIDEFDHLVHNRVSDPVRFFGALRSLATRSGALALLLASRSPLRVLDHVAQQHGYSGSPYFNFVTEVSLGPLSEDDVESLLDRAEERFSPEDRRYLREAAGGHPFLVQAAASALWDAYEDDHERPRGRRAAAASVLRKKAADVLRDIWSHWPAPTRHVFAAVAVEHLDALSGTIGLQRAVGLADLGAFDEEVSALVEQGFLVEGEGQPPRLHVQPIAFLEWCARELRRHAASATAWDAWLRQQGWDLSPEQQRAWVDRVRPGLAGARVDLDIFAAKGAPAGPRSRGPRSSAASAVRPPARVRIYCSHAKEDTALVSDFVRHLAPLQREEVVEAWSSRDVTAGDDWRSKADENLRAADVILLCVSSHYVASDYAWNVEVALALQRYRLGEARVVPVLLRPSDWKKLPFGTLEPLPRSGKAISAWTNPDEAWLDVVQGLRAEVERLAGRERTIT